MLEDLWHRTWYDNRENIVIWQMPNIWLIGWAVLTVISLLLNGKMADVFSWAASVLLIVWALLEIFRGANYFRRALGLLVLVFAIMTLLKSF
jgi:hypothetical protein